MASNDHGEAGLLNFPSEGQLHWIAFRRRIAEQLALTGSSAARVEFVIDRMDRLKPEERYFGLDVDAAGMAAEFLSDLAAILGELHDRRTG